MSQDRKLNTDEDLINGGSSQNSETIAGYQDTEWHYSQPLPSIKDPVIWYFKPFKSRTIEYVKSLLPILQWIHRYNLKWLYGDLIAGITVGVVVVPQGMSYATIAGLPVQYGLYSSFIGVMLYCFFATSKDVSIGPVAVMSALVYKITHRVLEKTPSLTEKDLPIIAGVLSLLCGGITFGMGVLRLGFILEYIPMPAVLGFMTGSAFTICVGQVPGLMGISKLFDTKGASYLVLINTLKHLHQSTVDAAFGLVSLFFLYLLKFVCGYLEKRDKKRKWLWFYLNTLRAAIVIIFSTLISWGCYRIYGKTKISMIGTVPRGFTDIGVHPVSPTIAKALASELPIATIVLVLEHIAISKSFGRINEYRINPNQELIAIGLANLIGHFFQAYPNTGSFSRTALKSKCGVRTPLAGIFTGACVIVAIYALTETFYYISKAALSAIIIHAVGDLVSSYKATWKFFLVAPIECLIFLVDVFLCIFVSLETGIYFSICACFVNLLLKQTFPLGEFLGKVVFTKQLHDVGANSQLEPVGDEKYSRRSNARNTVRSVSDKLGRILGSKNSGRDSKNDVIHEQARSVNASIDSRNEDSQGEVEVLDEAVAPSGPAEPRTDTTRPVVLNPNSTYTKWWPLTHDNINPGVRVVPPPPGVLVYRFRESITYQNASWQTDRIVEYVRANTRRNIDPSFYKNMRLGDRPWNETGPRKYKPPAEEDTRPILRAIVFDMSCSPNIDLTGAQALWDCHQELTKYACVPVEFHFAGILSEWSRRALVGLGFGSHAQKQQPPHTIGLVELAQVGDEEEQIGYVANNSHTPIVDTTNCYFHFDIPDLELR